MDTSYPFSAKEKAANSNASACVNKAFHLHSFICMFAAVGPKNG
jgi:hypothetical protein